MREGRPEHELSILDHLPRRERCLAAALHPSYVGAQRRNAGSEPCVQLEEDVHRGSPRISMGRHAGSALFPDEAGQLQREHPDCLPPRSEARVSRQEVHPHLEWAAWPQEQEDEGMLDQQKEALPKGSAVAWHESAHVSNPPGASSTTPVSLLTQVSLHHARFRKTCLGTRRPGPQAAPGCESIRPARRSSARPCFYRSIPPQEPPFPLAAFFSILAHVSFNETVRLNTSRELVESGSTQK
jgi:hypothetical protein